jgi:hypothetical protein
MRQQGWMVHNDGGQNKAKAIRWTLTPPEIDREPDPPHPPDPPPQVDADKSGGSDETLFPAADPPTPAGGLQGREAGYDNLPDPPINMPVTSGDGLAGQAGHDSGPSLVPANACCYCGGELKYSSARSRGHCSGATCLAAARQQTAGGER